MRKFNVKVNGKMYEVEIEEVFETASSEDPATPSAPASSIAPTTNGSRGDIEVKAPIQGNVVKIDVEVGASVGRGQRLCVLEAMKMEYDIVAPEDGVIATVEISRGVTAEDGKILFTIKG